MDVRDMEMPAELSYIERELSYILGSSYFRIINCFSFRYYNIFILNNVALDVDDFKSNKELSLSTHLQSNTTK